MALKRYVTFFFALLHNASFHWINFNASDSYFSMGFGTDITFDIYRFSHKGAIIASDSYGTGITLSEDDNNDNV
jgi:hypothetical protein